MSLQKDDNDAASIRNIPELKRVIDKNNIRYHFHGHTHGTFWTRIGKGYSLGVGPMLFKAAEMGSQFHLISIERDRVNKIVNYRYLGDLDRYTPVLVYPKTDTIDIDKLPSIRQEFLLKFHQPENYISRQAGPFDVVQRGGIRLYYNKEQIKLLYDLMMEKERIVLIGEGGFGKSYELQNLAYTIAQSKKALPVFVKLNNYVDEDIKDLISAETGRDDRETLILIFDGFDEIEEKNLNTFARKMNNFVKKNPEQFLQKCFRRNKGRYFL